MIPSVNISSITEDDSAAQIHETVKDSDTHVTQYLIKIKTK